MRIIAALPIVALLLVPQPAPDLVVSVGHTSPPSHAAFAGEFLATAERSTVAIVELSSGLTVARLPQQALVTAIEPGPSGDLLAVGTCDHAIQLWDLKSMTLVRRMPLPQECAESLSFSPDGRLLATGLYGCCRGARQGVQVWDPRSGTLVRELASGQGIRHVTFSGNGRWLAGVDAGGAAHVFEWPSGRLLRTIGGLGDTGAPDWKAIASRDGRYLAWRAHGLRAWDVASGKELAIPGAERVHITDKPPGGPERAWSEMRVPAQVARFLDDGRLAYADGDNLILLTLSSGARDAIPLPPPGLLANTDLVERQAFVAIRPDGRLLGGTRGTATIAWEPSTGSVRELSAPALASPGLLQWPRAGLVAWSDRRAGLGGWDDRNGRRLDFGDTLAGADAFSFRADGTLAAVAGLFSIQVVNPFSRRIFASREPPSLTETGIAMSADGSRVAFARSADAFWLFDRALRPERLIATLEPHTTVERVAFSPDGRWIAAGLGAPHPSFRVWPADGSSAGVTLDSADVTYGWQPPAFSADSRLLASFTRGSSVTVWTAPSWNVARAWTIAGSGHALAFSPDGHRLAVAADGEAAVWDADNGRRLVTLVSSGSSQMREIAWSPDGRIVVASADDGILRFWNAGDGRAIASLSILQVAGDWLLVAPDGRFDGSDAALASAVAWRTGGRVVRDAAQTARRRVRGLWNVLFPR